MKIIDYTVSLIEKNAFTNRLLHDKRYRIIFMAVVSLIFNMIYAFYNGVLGLVSYSVIFSVSSVYYFLLGSMRFFALMQNKNVNSKIGAIGVLLVILSVAFSVFIIFGISQTSATSYGTITMITIATYTFTKITVAVVNAVRHKRATRVVKAINAIRYCEIAVSLLTMQQSMLVSFGETDVLSRKILNGFTGGMVCLFILIMGILTINNARKE